MKFKKLATLTAVAAAAALATGAVMAGADDTFGTAAAGSGPVGTMQGWLQGSMGRMFAIGALAVGLGIGIVQQSVMSVAVGTGIALAASAGPTVLGAIFTSAF
jgi:conjugal transfer pilus assembly protein TraA